MSRDLDHTHDPQARSWVGSAQDEGTDFPLQNLPFGVFRPAGTNLPWRGGVAIGDQVLDLALLAGCGMLDGLAADAAQAASGPTLNPLLARGRPAWIALRHALFDLFGDRAPAATRGLLQAMLRPQAGIELRVPMTVGDYTDFFTSIDHVRNTGRQMLGDKPGVDLVMPNFRWMPIAYHGRASSIVTSGTPVRRPRGQYRRADAPAPVFGPCARLDYELEMGFVVGPGNALGTPIPLAQAEDHLFGVCLLNDWSARDIQAWEMAPLGPFLGKSFSTSVSPWIVTFEALAPFRCAWRRDADAPAPLPYLDDASVRAAGGLDIVVEAWLLTPARAAAGAAPVRLSRSNFCHQYWTAAQLVAHHSVGGCNLRAGDLLGSGTISGPGADEAGTMIEITWGGAKPLLLPGAGSAHGEERAFLDDGDTLTLRARCERAGAARIGFGLCAGTVSAAPAA